VIFSPLTRENIAQIVDIQLRRVAALLAQRGLTLEVSESAREYLAETGYDPDFGARLLKRAIQRSCKTPWRCACFPASRRRRPDPGGAREEGWSLRGGAGRGCGRISEPGRHCRPVDIPIPIIELLSAGSDNTLPAAHKPISSRLMAAAIRSGN